MNSLNKYLCELAEEFSYIIEVKDKEGNNIIEKKNYNFNRINFNVECMKERYEISISESAQSNIPLLRYIIKEKIEENIENKLSENTLLKILEDREIDRKERDNFGLMCKGISSIIIIKPVNINKQTCIALENCLKDNVEYYCIKNENVVIFNKFDNVDLDIHTLAYKLTTANILIKKIVYDKELNNNKVKSRVNKLEALSNLIDEKLIGKNIYTYQNAIFEILLNNIDSTVEKQILDKFKLYFDRLSDEMVKTIDTFFDKDLCLSEASKSLFIHRNTLVYRLDKIKKDILLDLRNFNDAINFYTIYRVWKNLR